MTIRQYAKSRKHKVVGAITRHTALEKIYRQYNQDHRFCFYHDEANNEYWVDTKERTVTIVTASGGVI